MRKANFVKAILIVSFVLTVIYLTTEHLYVTKANASVSYYSYSNLKEFIDASDLIVEVTPVKRVGTITSHNLAVSEVKINKIYKNDTKASRKINERIRVAEAYELRNYPGIMPGNIEVYYNNYTKLKKGQKYILFIKWSNGNKFYLINIGEMGKYNIDNKDLEELRTQADNIYYKKFRDEIFLKYSLTDDSSNKPEQKLALTSKNIDDKVDHVANLNEEELIEMLRREGIQLNGLQEQTLDKKHVLDGIKPSMYKFAAKKNDALYVYVFDSLRSRKKVAIWNSLTPNSGLYNENVTVFTARNILLVYIPSDKNDIESYKYAQSIGNIIFDKVNKAKELIFEGEGQYWKVVYKVRCFEYFMEDSQGRLSYDSYHFNNGELKFKGERKGKVGPISYDFNSGSGEGFLLDENGRTRIGGSAGNGSMFRKDNKLVFTIKWLGKTEVVELANKTNN